MDVVDDNNDSGGLKNDSKLQDHFEKLSDFFENSNDKSSSSHKNPNHVVDYEGTGGDKKEQKMKFRSDKKSSSGNTVDEGILDNNLPPGYGDQPIAGPKFRSSSSKKKSSTSGNNPEEEEITEDLTEDEEREEEEVEKTVQPEPKELKSKVAQIAKGGQRSLTFAQPKYGCHYSCKAKTIKHGCNFGHSCKVGVFTCTILLPNIKNV